MPPPNPARRLVALLLRLITLGGLVFICFEIGVWLDPPLMAWGLAVVDPHLICSSREALEGARQHQRVFDGDKELVAQAKILQKDGKLTLWHTARGDWWVPNGSEDNVLGFLVQQKNKIYGEGGWGIRKNDVVLDCGANIGVYTREALDDGASIVVAIEPAPVNVECLRRNFKREIEEKQVIVAALVVWDKDDVLPLYEDPQNSGADSFIIHTKADKVTAGIPLTSIDKLAKQYGLPRVDFIKMDIKGATEKALVGATGILTGQRPRLALSTEELEDNPARVRSVVLSLQPSYQMRCGICSVYRMRVNADVLLFRAGRTG